MIFAPVVPGWMLLVVAGLALAVAVRAYRRPAMPAVLRAVALAVVALMAANPVRSVALPERVRERIAVVIDRSASMATDDVPGHASRYAAALATADAVVAAFGDRAVVDVLGLSATGLDALPPSAPAGDTDFTALEQLARPDSARPGAVFLFSDGADWHAGDPAPALIAAGIAVHAFAVGDARPVRNLAVAATLSAPTVFPGQEVAVEVVVTASADLRGGRARLRVTCVEGDERGKEPAPLLDEEIVLAAEVRRQLQLPVGTRLGSRVWRSEIVPLAGERTTEDNAAFSALQVVDRNVRIAVFEGRPWWDTTFAVRAWRRDRQLSVRTAYGIGGKVRHSAASAAGAVEKARPFADTEVVVLGRQAGPLLGENAGAIPAFVDNGGGLVLLGPGPSGIAEVDALAPLTWDAAPKLSDGEADAGRAFAGLIPPGTAFAVRTAAGGTLKPHCRLLLGTREAPLIVQRRSGAGWICQVNLEGAWRWQMSPKAVDRDPGERFWRQLLRALTVPPGRILHADRSDVLVGEEMSLRLRSDAPPAAVEATAPDGTRSQLTPASGAVRILADQAGQWRFAADGEEVVVIARREAREALATARDDARLQRLAARTGGSSGDLSEAVATAQRLRTADKLAAAPTRHTVPLITGWPWFILVTCCLVCEWFIRRRFHGLT